MKIQFIVTGWYYNQDSLIDGLIELKQENDFIDVFYSCHKDPPQKIKDNLEWKLFPNLGMADGGFQQAIDHLNLDNDTIVFFFQDDIIIKNWEFIEICINKLNTYKFIGNCTNYPTVFDPNKKNKIGGTFRDFVKPGSEQWYKGPLQIKTLRSSFICTKYAYVKAINGFEPIFHYPDLVEPYQEDGVWKTKHEKGIGGMGNVILALMSYKINSAYGPESITYLSPKYLDSEYVYECARGNIDPNNKPT